MTYLEMSGFPILSAILMTTVLGLLAILFIPPEKTRLIKQVSLASASI